MHGRCAWAMCSLFTRFQLKKRLRLKKGRMWSAGLYGKCVSSGLACRTTVRCRAPAAARSYRHPPAASTAAPVITISVWPQLSTTFFHRLATACARCAAATHAASSRAARVASRRSTPLDAAQRRSTRARLHRSSRDTHHHARRRLTADCAPSAPHTCRVVHRRKGIWPPPRTVDISTAATGRAAADLSSATGRAAVDITTELSCK